MDVPNALYSLTEASDQLYFSYHVEENRFIYLNPAFIDFFDLDVQPTIPLLLAMVHPEDQKYVASQCEACLSGNTVGNLECRIVRRESQRYIRIFPYLITEASGRLLMGCAEDITTYKSQLNVISKHNAKKDSILNIVAHDLAAPLGFIRNLSTLLSREASNRENAKVREYSELVNKFSLRCIKLIKDFMDHEFLESAGVKLVKKRIDLIEKVKIQTEDYLNHQAELNKQIYFTSSRTHIYVDVDEDKFLQVINNLVSNALKFTREGGKITIGMEEQEHHVLVTIADDGIGIAKKYHATLFERFSDARRTGLKGEPSTGLGMSIIKTIVEWHDGTIWFDSEEGRGSTFYIQLPK
ncbi:two-component system sensor histidine kinase VicK [Arcticibacter pallidicorallinus]|uniref:histidine kinase n=1 Tax=Arcticibacter pallidicorallinus TaxID=1259464 RepID=A0A2T0UBK6_9SPHI|nr:PAS domain-containing sensor histidine kinase [Arcticibacter pallidicorallinus]PRY55197.1 two-component system sensor histidine kinase VicK [Arcticibacter pallidicorallinus]